MGYREYARHRGCTLYAVQKAIADKRIQTEVDADGKARIDSEAADSAWWRNTDPAKQSVMYTAPENGAKSRPAAADKEDADEPAAEDSTAEYRAARAEREQLRVRRERMQLEIEEGSLVSLADARQLVFTAFRTLRDGVLNVPTRIKHQLAADTDADRCEQMLEMELQAVLSAFDPEAALREQRDEDDEDAGA